MNIWAWHGQGLEGKFNPQITQITQTRLPLRGTSGQVSQIRKMSDERTGVGGLFQRSEVGGRRAFFGKNSNIAIEN